MAIDAICQIGIVVFSGSAILVVALKRPWSKWGFVLGLLSGPFYLGTSIINRQWGLRLLTVWWTGSWALGAWRHFRTTADG